MLLLVNFYCFGCVGVGNCLVLKIEVYGKVVIIVLFFLGLSILIYNLVDNLILVDFILELVKEYVVYYIYRGFLIVFFCYYFVWWIVMKDLLLLVEK